MVTDTLFINEFMSERFPNHALRPQDLARRAMERSLWAEMQIDFAALRQNSLMKRGPDLLYAKAIIWDGQPEVRHDVARL